MSQSNQNNRDSVADLEDELYDIFDNHHAARQTENGEPAIPASALVDIIRVFGENHDGMQLLSDDEEGKLQELVRDNPGLEVTPSILLGFLAALTSKSKEAMSPSADGDSSVMEVERELLGDESISANGRPGSRSSSRGPRTPGVLPPRSALVPDSPFNSGRRQRTAPLAHAAPSSWRKNKNTHGRRRSDAGSYGRSMSDNDSNPPSRPSSRQRRRGRTSNPVSPDAYDGDMWSPGSRPPSRPSSRAHSHGNYSMPNLDGVMSPNNRPRHLSEDDFKRSPGGASDDESVSGSEDGSDIDDETMGMMLGRSGMGSVSSLASREREEQLERTNSELQRRVVEQDRILQRKIAEHESELEEMEILLEETKSELSAKMREEKELRAKETRYIHQIAALESEIAERQRSLESSKTAYQSLQKLYQEQCTEAENLRNTLRDRDQQIRDHTEKISLHGLELNKWQQQQEQLETHMSHLEAQLVASREAQAQLDEQKQENLLLKETIDRMRFDMDELRTKADGNVPTTGLRDSGSIGKSLGVELSRMQWPPPEKGEESDDDDTAVSDDGSGEGDTEGEDVVQTIITRRKKKVASRAMKKVETIEYEDVRSYSDAYTQHDVSEFSASCTVQTDPEPKRRLATHSIQTVGTSTATTQIQTEPIPIPPSVLKSSMEVQTEPADERTPKPEQRDLPPSYADAESSKAQQRRDLQVAADAIAKWHHGLEVPLSPVQGGVSVDALEAWATLKEEMGFECLAIERVLEMSLKTGPRSDRSCLSVPSTPGPSSSTSTSSSTPASRRKGKLTNIYNTFVYGSRDDDGDRDRSLAAGLTRAAVVLGVCMLGAGMLAGQGALQPAYNVPGGPTYYDRAAWAEFNRFYPVGEGFVPDGAAGLWDFLGRVGGGAARMARGWPA